MPATKVCADLLITFCLKLCENVGKAFQKPYNNKNGFQGTSMPLPLPPKLICAATLDIRGLFQTKAFFCSQATPLLDTSYTLTGRNLQLDTICTLTTHNLHSY